MTEKRFIVAICGDGKLGIRDLTTLNEYTSERQVADYMNRITDENEQLDKVLQFYKSDSLETIDALERCYRNSKKSMKRIDVLEEENEQLKQEIETLHEQLAHMSGGDFE